MPSGERSTVAIPAAASNGRNVIPILAYRIRSTTPARVEKYTERTTSVQNQLSAAAMTNGTKGHAGITQNPHRRCHAGATTVGTSGTMTHSAIGPAELRANGSGEHQMNYLLSIWIKEVPRTWRAHRSFRVGITSPLATKRHAQAISLTRTTPRGNPAGGRVPSARQGRGEATSSYPGRRARMGQEIP